MARPNPDNARLAPPSSPSGTLLQLIVATLPLFLVLLYFLFQAHRRPSLAQYSVEEIMRSEGPLIGLMPMLYTFMAVFVLWSCLAAYLLIFVPKRRALVDRYVDAGYTVMGNVRYVPKRGPVAIPRCFRSETAVVTYAHPDPEGVNREMGTTYDDDGPARRRDWAVRRRVRTYRLYSRENVPIVLLPGLPRSGLAKTDVETDAATYRASDDAYHRDRIREVCRIVIFPWMAFALLGGIYVVSRMHLIDDRYDVPSRGWTVLLLSVFGLAPLLAGGGNAVRWLQYKNYVTNSGEVVEGDRARKLPHPDEEELNREDCGIWTMDVCGAPTDEELGIEDEDDNKSGDGGGQTPYRSMS